MLDAEAFPPFFQCFEFLLSIGDPGQDSSGVQSEFSLALGPKAHDFNAGKNALKGRTSQAPSSIKHCDHAGKFQDTDKHHTWKSGDIVSESSDKHKQTILGALQAGISYDPEIGSSPVLSSNHVDNDSAGTVYWTSQRQQRDASHPRYCASPAIALDAINCYRKIRQACSRCGGHGHS